MSKKLYLAIALCFLSSMALFSGDIAQYVNLGFSEDSRYFMFGQFGILEKGSAPYAETFLVDVASNAFVPQGTKSVSSPGPVEPGTNGLGALLILLEDPSSLSLQKKYRINHLLSGRILYFLVDGSEGSDTLEFRDFQTEKRYQISLTQSATGKGSEISSSFSISATIEGKGKEKQKLTIGHPAIQRKGVKKYWIKQILLAPDGKSLIFLMAKEELDARGNNIRFMVETCRIN